MSTQSGVVRHSPLPWTVEPPQVPSGLTHIYAMDPHAAGDPGDYVTVADYVNSDDAAFIVRAVNSHADLVQALTQLANEAAGFLSIVASGLRGFRQTRAAVLRERLDHARNLIAKTKEQAPHA